MCGRRSSIVTQILNLLSFLQYMYFCSCDKFDHKQEERFILYLLGQIISWQYKPSSLELN